MAVTGTAETHLQCSHSIPISNIYNTILLLMSQSCLSTKDTIY